MKERQYGESHLFLIAIRKGALTVIPEELDRVKRSSTYRFMCITEGECQLFISGESIHLQKNDIAFFRPGDIYRTLPLREMEVLNLYFTFDSDNVVPLSGVCELDKSTAVSPYHITDLPLLNQPFVWKNYASGVLTAEKIWKEKNAASPLSQKRSDVLLETLLLDGILHYEKTEAADSKRARLLSGVTSYIRAHIHEKLTCRAIATHLGYHPNYLNELVTSAVGISIHQFISEQKIKFATEELITTSKSITQIAQDYAFCDSSHFNRRYVSVTGVHPSDVRKAARQSGPLPHNKK